jgi:hypothetical protein
MTNEISGWKKMAEEALAAPWPDQNAYNQRHELAQALLRCCERATELDKYNLSLAMEVQKLQDSLRSKLSPEEIVDLLPEQQMFLDMDKDNDQLREENTRLKAEIERLNG